MPSYVAQVTAGVTRVRQRVAWLNAMSVEASAEEIASIERLPFVVRVDLVRGYRRRGGRRARRPCQAATSAPQGSGESPRRLRLRPLRRPAHPDRRARRPRAGPARRGRDGGRVRHRLRHAVPRGLRRHVHRGPARLRERRRRRGQRRDRGEGSHGTETLSVLGGYAPGHLIGPAFNATFILAKTEDTSSETPVEEDNWAAAAEWAEARGADVISSSLGYLTYDPGFPSYTADDMNGQTAISHARGRPGRRRAVSWWSTPRATRASSALHNTLGAPADGRLVLTAGAVTSSGVRAASAPWARPRTAASSRTSRPRASPSPPPRPARPAATPA